MPLRKLRKHPRRNTAVVVVGALFGVLLLGSIIFYTVYGLGQVPKAVWLPDAAKFNTSETYPTKKDLPITSEKITTKYGKAIRFSTVDNWQTVYEFRSNGTLRAAACPNITNVDELLPSGCDKVGSFEGAAVYAINRRLPSGTTEYYFQIDATFVYVSIGGDGGRSLDYIQTFKKIPLYRIDNVLAENKKQVAAYQAKQKAAQEATDRYNKAAYTRLDFTPALPQALPDGWKPNTESPMSMALDGPDADHPKMLNVDYHDAARKQFIGIHAGKLSDFQLGVTCGPSPGYSMEHLGCVRQAGTNYYVATRYTEYNDFVRYVYYPVGDSLVISEMVVYAQNNKSGGLPTALIATQDALTLSAKPVDEKILKSTAYYRLYY